MKSWNVSLRKALEVCLVSSSPRQQRQCLSLPTTKGDWKQGNDNKIIKHPTVKAGSEG